LGATPLNLSFFVETTVMSDSPENDMDVLLLWRKSRKWTAAQLSFLPDSVRNTKATNILLEFGYAKSLDEQVLQQAIANDFCYRHQSKLRDNKIQAFLLITKQPQEEELSELGYKSTELPGVYRSQHQLIKNIVLLSINELSNEPHNAFVKNFAIRRQMKQNVSDMLENSGLDFTPLKMGLREKHEFIA
jgi:hypothetical protein